MKTIMKILILGTDDQYIQELSNYLDIYRLTYQICQSPQACLQSILKDKYHVVISSVFYKDIFGLDLLDKIKELSPATSVILNTTIIVGSLKEEAIKRGAFAVYEKSEIDLLVKTVLSIQNKYFD
ncbi:MAG: response regulator [Spirochaetes bacterium]|nr:response regulator [Spirochaetota bacterium]